METLDRLNLGEIVELKDSWARVQLLSHNVVELINNALTGGNNTSPMPI